MSLIRSGPENVKCTCGNDMFKEEKIGKISLPKSYPEGKRSVDFPQYIYTCTKCKKKFVEPVQI
jgi:hypothetical protein